MSVHKTFIWSLFLSDRFPELLCVRSVMSISKVLGYSERVALYVYFLAQQFYLFIYLFFSFIFISWRLITSQHCSGFCHTLT